MTTVTISSSSYLFCCVIFVRISYAWLLVLQLSARKLQKPPISTTKVEQEDHVLKDEEELLKPDELRSEGQHKTVAADRRKRGTKVIDLVNLGPIIPPWRKELLNKAQDKARSIRVEFKPEAVET